MTNTENEVMSKEESLAFEVFVAAVERYLDSVDEASGQEFELWLDTHAEDEEMLPHLLQTYPKFGDIFTEEIEKIKEPSE